MDIWQTCCLNQDELRRRFPESCAIQALSCWIKTSSGSFQVCFPAGYGSNSKMQPARPCFAIGAEPISAAAHTLLGYEYPKGYLEVAWKWLLTNHPHDSICGCSIDAVHEDMRYRFHQCQDIAERITGEAALHLAASIEGEPGTNELRGRRF